MKNQCMIRVSILYIFASVFCQINKLNCKIPLAATPVKWQMYHKLHPTVSLTNS